MNPASLLQHEMLAAVAYGSWSCKNANARHARRNILEKLRVIRIDDSADMRLDAVLENCIFYIFPMYEFLHSLVRIPTFASPTHARAIASMRHNSKTSALLRHQCSEDSAEQSTTIM